MGLETDIIPQLTKFKNITPNSKVLNLTHKYCVDGVGSQIVLKNFFNNIVFQEATYHEIDEMVGKINSEMFDVVIISDISPSNAELLDKHKNLILLDHHESALHLHKPEKFRYVYDKECGASLTKRFIETVFGADLSYLNELIHLTNDYDMWLHEDPKSHDLGALYYMYWNEKYRKRFMNGDMTWSPDELEFIRKRKHEVEEHWNNLERYDFGSINGCLCLGTYYINDICGRLITKENYDVVVFRNMKNKGVSVRSKEGVDIGGVVTDLGFGGGHKQAGGISEKDTGALMDKLKVLESELFKRYKHIRA